MPDTVLLLAEERMEHSIESLKREFAKLRSGRANPKMFDGVTVEYYGVPTPINQVAGVSIPEANQIYIKPYDKSLVTPIEKAIFAANLGVTPSNDGVGVRIVLPALTQERRRETVKEAKRIAEESKVAIRNIRKDANNDLKKMEKDKLLTEDDSKFYQDEVQKLTDKFVALVEKEESVKEDEILKL